MLDIQRLMTTAFPKRRIAGHEVLEGGLININLKVYFECDFDPVVLRVYRDGPAACNKEVAIHNLVHGSVPVADIIYAHAEVPDDLPSFAVLEYVEGITFQKLKRTNDRAAIHQAAASTGEILAHIGSFKFRAAGELLFDEGSRKLAVGQKFIDGPNPIPRILDRFLALPTFQRRAEGELVERLHNLVWSQAALLPTLENDQSLVHNDYGNRNILVRQENGRWQVAAILDWELGISGSPLLDVGHFLRYERQSESLREPHFSRAFVENGGYLPDGWHSIVRLIDLTALVECLTHENLPKDVEAELFQLINTTLKEASEIHR